MFTLITYDIKSDKSKPNINTLVKNAMKAKGYLDTFERPSNPGVIYTLPNTALVKEGVIPAIAKNDLDAIATANGAIVERMIATEISNNYVAIIGEPFSSFEPTLEVFKKK